MSKLTDARIERMLAHPSTGDREISAESNGLSLRIKGGTNKASFQVRYRWRGRSRRIGIGAYPDISADDARGRALDIQKEIYAGHDPAAQRRADRVAQKEAVTVADLMREYMDAHIKIGCTAATARSFKSAIDRHILPALGRVALREVTSRAVVLMIDRVKARGARRADHGESNAGNL